MSGPREMRLHDLDEHDVPAERTPRWRPNGEPPVRGQDAVTEPIQGRLGHVRVAEHGALTGVDLDEHALRGMSPDRVADYLVTAINRAQGHTQDQFAGPPRPAGGNGHDGIRRVTTGSSRFR